MTRLLVFAGINVLVGLLLALCWQASDGQSAAFFGALLLFALSAEIVWVLLEQEDRQPAARQSVTAFVPQLAIPTRDPVVGVDQVTEERRQRVRTLNAPATKGLASPRPQPQTGRSA